MDTSQHLDVRLSRLPSRFTCTLTHYGRKTGAAYCVTVWFTADGDHLNLHTMGMQRQWVLNVLANPCVRVQIGSEILDGSLAEVTDDDEMRRVVKLMKRKYPIALPYLWWRGRPAGAFRLSVSPNTTT